jgi:hypothetical protein
MKAKKLTKLEVFCIREVFTEISSEYQYKRTDKMHYLLSVNYD